MAVSEEVLNILITAKNEASGELAALAGQTEGIGATLAGFGQAMTMAGAGVTVVGAAVAGGIIELVRQASNYQTSLMQLRNNTSMTTGEMNKAHDAILQIGQDSGSSFAPLLEGFRQAFSLSGDYNSALAEVKVGNESAVATGSDVASTINALANVMHEYGVDTDASAAANGNWGSSADAAAHYMGVLHVAAQQGNMTLDDFVTKGGRVFSWAANLGVPLEDAAANFATMTKHGYNAATAATQVADVMYHIMKPSTAAAADEIANISKKTGVDLVNDFTAAGLHGKGLTGVFHDMSDAFQKMGLTQAEADEEVMKMIPNIRGGVEAFTMLGTGANDYSTILGMLHDDTLINDITQKQYNDTLQTVGQQFNILKMHLQAAAIELGEKFLPLASQLLGQITPLIDKIRDWAMAHAGLIVQISTTVAKIALIVGPIMMAIGVVSTLIATFNPLSLVVAAVGIAIGLFVREASTGFQNLRDPVQAVLSYLQQALGQLEQAVPPVRTAILLFTTTLQAFQIGGLQGGLTFLRQFFDILATKATDAVGTFVAKVPALQAAFNTIRSVLSAFQGSAGGGFAAIGAAVGNAFDSLRAKALQLQGPFEEIKRRIGDFFSMLGTAVSTYGPAVLALFASIGGLASGVFPAVIGAIGNFINLLISGGNVIGGFVTHISTIVRITRSLGYGWGALLPLIGSLTGGFTGIGAAVAAFLPQLALIGIGIGAGILAFNAIKEVMEATMGTLENLRSGTESNCNNLTSLWNGLRTDVVHIFNVIAAAFDPLVQQFKESWPQIATATGPAVEQFIGLMHALMPILAAVAAIIVTGLVVAINTLGSTVLRVLPDVINVFTGAVQVIRGVLQVLYGVFETVFGTILALVQGNTDLAGQRLRDGWNNISSGVVNIIKGFVGLIGNTLKGGFDLVVGLVGGLIKSVINLFTNLADELVGHSIIPDMMNAIVQSITEGFGRAVSAITSFVGQAIAALQGAVGQFTQMGVQMVQGLIGGITSMAGNVAGAISGVVGGAVNAAKAALGIASPSKVMNEVGQQTMQGYNQGVQSQASLSFAILNGIYAHLRGQALQNAQDIKKAANDQLVGLKQQVTQLDDEMKGADKATVASLKQQRDAIKQNENDIKQSAINQVEAIAQANGLSMDLVSKGIAQAQANTAKGQAAAAAAQVESAKHSFAVLNQIMSELPKAAHDQAKAMKDQVNQEVAQMTTDMNTKLKNMQQDTKDAVDRIKEEMKGSSSAARKEYEAQMKQLEASNKEAMKNLKTDTKEQIYSMKDDTIQKIEQMAQDAGLSITGMTTAVTAKVQSMAQSSTQSIKDLNTAGKDAMNNLQTGGVDSATTLSKETVSQMDQMRGQAEQVMIHFRGSLLTIYSVMHDDALAAGKSLGDGLKQGIVDRINEIRDAAIQAAQAAISAAKNALGVHSPSTVFHEIGQNVGQGLINGVNSMGSSVTSSITSLVNGGMSGSVSLAGSGNRSGITINNNYQGNTIMTDKDIDAFARKVSEWQRRQVDLHVIY